MNNFQFAQGIMTVMAIAMIATSTPALARPAKCEIDLDDGSKGIYVGPCDFQSEKGGSFSVTSINPKRNLYREIVLITVYVGKDADLPRDQAFFTYNRLNDRQRNGGQLFRSRSKPACWVNEFNRICVY